MKNRTPLQVALRQNQRNKKLPELLEFLSSRLRIPVESIETPSLDESDLLLDTYRSRIAQPGNVEKRIAFTEQEKLATVLKGIKSRLSDEPVYLYSTPLCEVCGAVKSGLYEFLDRATDLAVLNANAVYVISGDFENCIDLTYDTEYSSESGSAYYALTIKGRRYNEK